MKKYKSKIDLWLIIILTLVFGGIVIISIIKKDWIGFIIAIIPTIFIWDMFKSTFYIITEEELIIRCGIFYKLVIKINDIRKISESNDLISSPALSIDRLEILYNRFDTILISPKKKYEFLQSIETLKPDIEINFRK
jgi:hypothetical protein